MVEIRELAFMKKHAVTNDIKIGPPRMLVIDRNVNHNIPVKAFRFFRLITFKQTGFCLRSIFYHKVWRGAIEEDDTGRISLDNNCGLYSFSQQFIESTEIINNIKRMLIFAEVELLGPICAHKWGFRSKQLKILKLTIPKSIATEDGGILVCGGFTGETNTVYPSSDINKIVEELGRRYSGVNLEIEDYKAPISRLAKFAGMAWQHIAQKSQTTPQSELFASKSDHVPLINGNIFKIIRKKDITNV